MAPLPDDADAQPENAGAQRQKAGAQREDADAQRQNADTRRENADAQRQDADALRASAAGDEEAFSTFYRRHLDGVVAFFMRRVGDRELALDLTAETFAAVVVGAHTYVGDGPAVAWLFGIARNKLRESLRRDRVADAARRRLGMEPLVVDDRALALVEERAGDSDSTLTRALQELPQATRAALFARVVEEEEYGEIAARLHCSQQVVRQRVHRGLEQLRSGMKEGS